MSKRFAYLLAAAAFVGGVAFDRLGESELFAQESKKPEWSHGLMLKARKGDEDNFTKDTKRYGVEVFTDINGKVLDAPEFLPLFERMARLDLPILLHPRRTNTTPDYATESRSKFLVYTNFGWPMETSVAMARLAFGGVLERFPTLKIITHHAGGLIPYFHKRVELSWDFNQKRMGYDGDGATLTRLPVDYYRMFYCDTAIQGNTAALMCAYEFFGADHMVFATDMPYDSEFGAKLYRETIPAVFAMPIDEASRARILEGNARRVFKLPASE